MSAWQQVTDSFCSLSDSLLTGRKASRYVNIYFVDNLSSSNSHTQADYLLWIQNGEERYNYATDGVANSITLRTPVTCRLGCLTPHQKRHPTR